jgi:hypothetical protein
LGGCLLSFSRGAINNPHLDALQFIDENQRNPKVKIKYYFLTVAVCSANVLFAVNAHAELSREEVKTQKNQIETTYKSDKESCGSLSGNSKDICMEVAKGHEKTAKAELEYRQSGKQSDYVDWSKARINADYSVAKEKCDDLSGNQKDVCVTSAKSERKKAMANVELMKDTQDAKQDAVNDKQKADYKVAAEKCNALSGDAKDSCVEQAKMQYGQ